MNFEFSDDQRLLRDQVRRFLDDNASVKAARTILDDGGRAYDRDLWRSIAELGWTGAIIPEEFGGANMNREDLCVIAEELGRSLAPTPFASSVYLATEALLIAGDDGHKSHYLPELADGQSIGCFAMAEGGGFPTPTNVKTTFFEGKPKLTKLLRTLSAYFFTLLLLIRVSPSFLPIGDTATNPKFAFGFLSTVVPIASNNVFS